MSISKEETREVYDKLRDQIKRQFRRTVSFADYLPIDGSELDTKASARAPASTTTFSY